MESCRVPGLSLCNAKASVVISVPFCTAGCQEFGVETGHLWHPTPHGFRERNAHCLAPSSYFHHAQCCEHTNRTQIVATLLLQCKKWWSFRKNLDTCWWPEYIQKQLRNIYIGRGQSRKSSAAQVCGCTACPSTQLPQLPSQQGLTHHRRRGVTQGQIQHRQQIRVVTLTNTTAPPSP